MEAENGTWRNTLKAFAFDFDDTLLHDDLSISDFTINTFHRLQSAGILPIPASGRTPDSLEPFLEKLHFNGTFICSNGAIIADRSSGTVLRELFIPVDLFHRVIDFGNRNHVYMQTYEKEFFLYNHDCIFSERYSIRSSLKGIVCGDLHMLSPERRCKILMMDTETKISEMYHEAVTLFDGLLSVSCSKPYYLEFNPVDANKGNALSFIARRHGIPLSEIVSFGDGINDLTMLRISGLSVAVSNACEAVRKAADVICGSNEEDGVSHFLLSLFSEVIP